MSCTPVLSPNNKTSAPRRANKPTVTTPVSSLMGSCCWRHDCTAQIHKRLKTRPSGRRYAEKSRTSTVMIWLIPEIPASVTSAASVKSGTRSWYLFRVADHYVRIARQEIPYQPKRPCLACNASQICCFVGSAGASASCPAPNKSRPSS